ncbi:MAG: YchF/TatD family DNA exonuclease [Thermodesulfovibrionales bacterium]|nr:YchF/TatD family DNA exonuclease [Thermodesulfovibrionales bacterium]
MIDTHCHLDMFTHEVDREEVISRAFNEGVNYIISIGADLQASKIAMDIANSHDGVYVAIGIHPHDAKDVNSSSLKEMQNMIKKALNSSPKKLVAIGEIGLDYYYNHSPRDVQKSAFKSFLDLSKEFDLPVIIHNRDADEDTKRILQESGIDKALFHCFSSDYKMAQWIVERGYYLSFAGNITFKKAQQIRDVALQIPDDKFMIETDAPFLAPDPLRGKRNEPSYLIHTARLIAKIREISIEDIDRITSLNAQRFFNIGIIHESEIAYKIRDNLYLNITNRCSNACVFCVKYETHFVKGHNLKLEREPSADEVLKAIGNPKSYKEIVFCGLGEPTLRLEELKKVAKWIKENGGFVRLNTNGLGNLINRRNILPELKGLVDSISISLNAHDDDFYRKICKPIYKNAYDEILNFIKESKKYIQKVMITVVDIEGIDLNQCRQIAKEIGVELRVRTLDKVG